MIECILNHYIPELPHAAREVELGVAFAWVKVLARTTEHLYISRHTPSTVRSRVAIVRVVRQPPFTMWPSDCVPQNLPHFRRDEVSALFPTSLECCESQSGSWEESDTHGVDAIAEREPVGMTSQIGPRRTRLLIRCTPKVEDPRELKTIVVSSLRDLWGDLETHSYGCLVETANGISDDNPPTESNSLSIICNRESLQAVRAALTLATLPPYLEISGPYRFDVVDIRPAHS